MPTSYVEDVTAAWLSATDHLVFRNIWVLSGGARRHRTDIDILAAKDGAVTVYSCKSFLGTGKAEVLAAEHRQWFDGAEVELRADPRFTQLIRPETSVKRVLVVDMPGSKSVVPAIEAQEIKVLRLRDIFSALTQRIIERLKLLNPKAATKDRFWIDNAIMTLGQENELVTRLAIALIMWDFMPDKVLVPANIAVTETGMDEMAVGLEVGELCALTKFPGYADQPWCSLATFHGTRQLAGDQVTTEYVDHFYAEGVQDQITTGLRLPGPNGLHVWESERARLVTLVPLTWDYVAKTILPRLPADGRPTEIDELRQRYRPAPVRAS